MRYLLPTVALLMGAMLPSFAHVGDRILPVYEITEDAAALVDLMDGQVDEWELMGPPTATGLDFVAQDNGVFERLAFEPSDLDFRIWLGWSASPPRIYAAIIRIDDRYVNEWGEDPPDQPMAHHDAFRILIDADHSGGPINEPEFLSSGQFYDALPTTPGERFLCCRSHLVSGEFGPEWYLEPPYADGGGAVFGENPFISVTEFYVTPFRRFDHVSEGESEILELQPELVIGLALFVFDNDSKPGDRQGLYLLPTTAYFGISDADTWADGLLLDGSGDGHGSGSVVEADVWGRIKASLSD